MSEQQETQPLERFDPSKHNAHGISFSCDEAVALSRVMKMWCAANSWELEISNLGHHWRFKYVGTRHFAEWWPSSGKLAIDGKYKRAVYAKDVYVLRMGLTMWLHEHMAQRGGQSDVGG